MFIDSEKMKAVGVKHSFKWFSHRRRENDCTMGRVQGRVRGGCFEAERDPGWGNLRAEEDGWVLPKEGPMRKMPDN